jgi:hypothetical protein
VVPTTGHEWKRGKPRRGAGMASRDFRRPNRGLFVLKGSRRGDLMSDVPPGQPLLIRQKCMTRSNEAEREAMPPHFPWRGSTIRRSR